jgi:hypothetical protein
MESSHKCSGSHIPPVCLALVAIVALMAGFTSSAQASPGALKVMILESQCSSTEPATTLRAQIISQAGVESVDFFNGAEATPTDAQLSAYDVVVAIGGCKWKEATALGNNLADYQDQGGVVVGATFDWQGTGAEYDLAGRWITAGYSPYEIGGTSEEFGNASLGTHEAGNPLLAGVLSLSAYFRDKLLLAPGATEIAKWSDGLSAIAVKGNAIGINANLGSFTGAQFSGDFGKLIVNAGNILGRHPLTVTKTGTGEGIVTSSPTGISCGADCLVAFPNGSSVTLTARTIGGGSIFSGWSGAGCSGTATCSVPMNAAQSVTATFTGPPPTIHCTVPKLKGKKLKSAKKALLKAECKLGKVRGKKNSSAKVKTQKPKPGTVLSAGSKVNVTVK